MVDNCYWVEEFAAVEICAEVLVPVNSNAFVQTQKILLSPSSANDFFGRFVSLSGDYAVAGAPGDNSNAGTATFYHWDGTTWVSQGTVAGSDTVANDAFGRNVAIDGDTAAIAAPGDDTSRGAVYIFTRTGSTWTQQQKLTASDRAANDFFGVGDSTNGNRGVDISGDRVVVGAPGDDDTFGLSGSAYVFHRSETTWSQIAKLNAFDPSIGDTFGGGVAIDGDYILVGSSGDDDLASGAGAAYCYEWDGSSWNYTQKLTEATSSTSLMGIDVALDGDTAVVGSSRGMAYVYLREAGTYSLQQTLVPPASGVVGFYGNGFGSAVNVSGDLIIVGDNAAWSPTADSSGALLIFQRTAGVWEDISENFASDPTTDARYGRSVSIDGDRAMTCADGLNSTRGAVYMLAQIPLE